MKDTRSEQGSGIGMVSGRGGWWVAAGLLLALWLVPTQAQAQLTDEEKDYLKEKTDGPSSIFVLTPRIRAIGMPGFIWDLFLDRHSTHWEGQTNLSYGLEFILRKPSYDLVFNADYTDYSQPDDWFLEKDDPARKADLTSFPLEIVSLTVGVKWFFDISPVFGLFVGGGLGAGVVLGEVVKTDPSPECLLFLENQDLDENGMLNTANDGDPNDPSRLDQAPCVDSAGNPQITPGSGEVETDIPPVVPLVNIGFGAQFTFADHYVWRLETGTDLLYFYAGTSIGYQWW